MSSDLIDGLAKLVNSVWIIKVSRQCNWNTTASFKTYYL